MGIEISNEKIYYKLPSFLETNTYYKTRGGWKCLVIWINKNRDTAYVVHKPNKPEECLSFHYLDGKAYTLVSAYEPPSYGKRPADIIEKWDDLVERGLGD